VPPLRTRNGCGPLGCPGFRIRAVLVRCSRRNYGQRRKVPAEHFDNHNRGWSCDLRSPRLQQAVHVVPVLPNTRAYGFSVAPDVGGGCRCVRGCAPERHDLVALGEGLQRTLRDRNRGHFLIGPMVFSRQRWSSHNRRKRPITPMVETVGCGSIDLLQ
jgi:hypothetical protein